MSVSAFFQVFKLAGDPYGIHEGAAMWFWKELQKGPAEAAVKAQIALTSSANVYHERASKSYSAIVQFLLKRFVTDHNKAELNAEVRNLSQGSTTPAEYAKDRWTKTLRCQSVYDEKTVMALFVEGVIHPIR